MRTRTARCAAEHAAGVPPGGFEPPPAIFAESCPVHGTVAGVPTGDRARGGLPGRSQRMESNHLRRGIGRAGALPGLRGIRRGTGWIRTSAHPFNKRPLNQLSFGPKCRCVATPAAVARRAFAAAAWSGAPRASEVGHDRKRRRAEIDPSRIPASSGSAMRISVRRHPGRPAWPRFPVLLVTTARPGAGARRPPGLVVAIDTCMSTATRPCCARRSAGTAGIDQR